MLMAPIRPPFNGPRTCNTFSASISASSESTRATPRRSNRALTRTSEPASDAVWDTTIFWATSERPHLMATMGFPSSRATFDCLFEDFRVGHRFHIEPKRRDSILPSKGVDRIVEIELQLVPQRDHVSDGKATPLHGEVETHVRRHGDDGHAFVDPFAALLIGPEHRPSR